MGMHKLLRVVYGILKHQTPYQAIYEVQFRHQPPISRRAWKKRKQEASQSEEECAGLPPAKKQDKINSTKTWNGKLREGQ